MPPLCTWLLNACVTRALSVGGDATEGGAQAAEAVHEPNGVSFYVDIGLVAPGPSFGRVASDEPVGQLSGNKMDSFLTGPLLELSPGSFTSEGQSYVGCDVV
ncbi:unnamed protein product [Polarella glacialis]|uniref:Uncharacterized protein n=1 Tax=Polarella glacialis TaxID=89957 RepID=A0A813GNH6_POLGL|nr:unnamed protein product [Polarella glacialis]